MLLDNLGSCTRGSFEYIFSLQNFLFQGLFVFNVKIRNIKGFSTCYFYMVNIIIVGFNRCQVNDLLIDQDGMR